MLQMQPTLPYSTRVEVPDTDLIIPPIRRFLPQTELNFQGLAAISRRALFLFQWFLERDAVILFAGIVRAQVCKSEDPRIVQMAWAYRR